MDEQRRREENLVAVNRDINALNVLLNITEQVNDSVVKINKMKTPFESVEDWIYLPIEDIQRQKNVQANNIVTATQQLSETTDRFLEAVKVAKRKLGELRKQQQVVVK